MAIRRNLQWFVLFWAILVANPGLAHAQATQTAPSVSVVESRPVRLDAASHSGQGLLRVRSTTSDRILLRRLRIELDDPDRSRQALRSR
jgi:hypothetical protein